jgi:hypothetical protein
MSLHRIPNRLLNTTLHIIRDSVTLDEVGDADTVRELAYGSIRANVQPEPGRNNQQLEYEIQGKLHKATNKAFFNRFEDGVKRTIIPGDYAIDLEEQKHYLVLSVLEYQAPNSSISDSHHIKLIMATVDGTLDIEQSATISSKARIA